MRGARPGRAGAPRRRKWGRWLLLLALLALALFLLWPAPPPPPPAPEPPPVAAAPAPAPAHRAPPRKKPAPPQAAPPPSDSQRALLMAAVQQRAPQLRSCELPPGAPGRVATRLRIAQAGKTRSVAFTSTPALPAPLATCLRERILQWDFAEVQLRSDVELLASFTLGG
ncbi:hypothetical protein FGE12_06730 [Aggregicoccus sp. 17bor-14]|uniref:hypothetical protein n=1 Tax=Myxococcaceae TaxID=31 RepID=UPI00129CC4A2|nr:MULTISPECIES: hypothetical protein [Myxococcaceae]MBF5042084.1 hypothetical protein [Simulacricoccus sp. 17bor-14]MRI87862.1 hypothetical protein [Aggregicoccus sp. 17bor-14]